ncbi:MAG: NYN domain-containing protein [Heliobacteriaceae bacterium]|jgi:uncharacterized LabA/DUF88 family protein|nr:NYN domain-containing protein [Heliobacteriaceae bacterium]
MSKILVLIDGFNFYHRLDDYQYKNKVCVKWLNYKKLLQAYFDDVKNNSFEFIYFSAYAEHRGKNSVERHKIYVKALETQDIKVVLGKFKKKTINRCKRSERCSGCNSKQDRTHLTKHEEKNTDVNIAITIVEKALEKGYDTCYILSSDSDFDTAIARAKEVYPTGRIVLVPPPQPNNSNRKKPYYIQAVQKLTKSKPLFISWEKIKNSQFPDEFKGLHNPWAETGF